MPENVKPWSRRLALLVAAAFFMENLDATILATAAPAIASDFGVAPADTAIAMTSYLLALATFIPVSGWLAGRWGADRVFAVAIVLFTLASVVCAFSGDLVTLTIARAVQGIGGSMMVPVGRLIVLRSTRKSDLIRAIAYLTWPALAAPVIAPVIGGALVQYAGWPWVFWVNVPIGVALFLLSWRIVPRQEADGVRTFDLPGFALVTVAVAGFIVGGELAADDRTSGIALPAVGAAVLLGVAAVSWLLRAREPFLDVRSFALQTFRVANGTSGLLFRMAVSAAPFLLPLLLQDGFDWSPVTAGAMVLWLFAGNIAIKPLTTPLIRNLGFVTVMVASGLGLAASFVAIAVMPADVPLPLMGAAFFASGVFRSVGFTAYNTIQFADVPANDMRHANTLSETVGQIAIATGIAASALCARLFGTGAPGADAQIGYRWALFVMALVAVVSVVDALLLPRGVAAAVRGRR